VTSALAASYSNSTGTVTSTNGGNGNTISAGLLVSAAPCDATTVTHGSITYPSATSMQMTINNATGKTLTIYQTKIWWNYAYGHYQNSAHPRTPLSLYQVQLGSVILYGPNSSGWPTSPLAISGSGNVLSAGTSTIEVTFLDTYDNHEYDAFTMSFTNSECSGFTLSAP
jgi:hypothetical protein